MVESADNERDNHDHHHNHPYRFSFEDIPAEGSDARVAALRPEEECEVGRILGSFLAFPSVGLLLNPYFFFKVFVVHVVLPLLFLQLFAADALIVWICDRIHLKKIHIRLVNLLCAEYRKNMIFIVM